MSHGSSSPTTSDSSSSSSSSGAETVQEWSLQNQTDSLLHYNNDNKQVFYRRMTPSEDLVATLLGIDVLVRQRQELIDRLVGHHQKLARRNEIGALTEFSKEIDRIMK